MQHLKAHQNEKDINMMLNNTIALSYSGFMFWRGMISAEDNRIVKSIYDYLSLIFFFFSSFLNLPQIFHLCTDVDITRL